MYELQAARAQFTGLSSYPRMSFHFSYELADSKCPTCGKEDDHERRDCPYNLICFRCGLAGHKIQVSLPRPTVECQLIVRIAVNPALRVVRAKSVALEIILPL